MLKFIKYHASKKLVYLIVAFLFYALLGLFNEAKADYPKTFSRYESGFYDGAYHSFTNMQDACDAYLARSNNSKDYPPYFIEVCDDGFTRNRSTVNNADFWSMNYTKYGTCEGVETVWGDGMCAGEPPNNCVDGTRTSYPRGDYSITKTLPTSGCVSGCAVIVQKSPKVIQCGGGGVMWCSYIQDVETVTTGETCTGTSVNPPSPEPIPERADSDEAKCLKAGKNYGYVSGVVVCTNKNQAGTEGADMPPETDTKTINNPDGSTTTTTTTTTQNADGTITKETTTTTTPSGGGTPTTETKTENQDSGGFCEENPNSPLCGEQESFCDKPENADALQCMKAGEPIDDQTITQNDRTITFSVPSGGGGGGCAPDVQMPLGIEPIPMQPLCDIASAPSSIWIAFCFLTAGYIVFRKS